jgi:flagellar protein FlaJ
MMTLLKKYQQYLRNSGLKVNVFLWIALSAVFSVMFGLLAYLLLPVYPFLALLVFIILLDLFLAFPYLRELKRIDSIEENLPDALRQMADTLRSGGTYEYALREIASSEYGPLRKEMEKVLRKLEEGENFENALMTLSRDVDSRLIKRTMTIIVDSVKAGAGLADLLTQISDDVRAMHRMGRERKSRTIMQTIFIFLASSMVAPAIFGFTATIISILLGSVSGVAASSAEIAAAEAATGIIFLGVHFYLLVEVAAAAAMISLMREGRLSKVVFYFPPLIFLAYVCYLLAGILSKMLITGVGI